MEFWSTPSALGIFCLLCTSLADGAVHYTRKPAVYDTRDSVHQIAYNYPTWPRPEPTHRGFTTARPLHKKPQQSSEVVTTLEQFYRVSPHGFVEFMYSLSDGQTISQKIYTPARRKQSHPFAAFRA